jgi:hypothetical protein
MFANSGTSCSFHSEEIQLSPERTVSIAENTATVLQRTGSAYPEGWCMDPDMATSFAFLHPLTRHSSSPRTGPSTK